MTPSPTPREELLLGWIAQANCYSDLTREQIIDAAHDLPSALEQASGIPQEVPVFIRAKRNKT
jgi:hypothetical protein